MKLRTQPGNGQDKSKGHLAFVGKWEYFVANGQVYRAAKNTTYIDSKTGYRSGGRGQGAGAVIFTRDCTNARVQCCTDQTDNARRHLPGENAWV